MNRTHKAVYFDVCCYIWDKAEPCPEAELPLMLGDLDGWREALDQLIAAGKLERTSEGVVNRRAMEESERALDVWGKKVAAGKARRAAATAKAPARQDAGASAPQDAGDGARQNQNQNQNQNQKEQLPTSRKRDGYSDEFEAFWSAYPNRKGKAAAWKAWQKLPPDDRQSATQDVPRRLALDRQWKRSGGEFIPHGSTYLNQRGWEDDIIAETAHEAHQRTGRRESPAERTRRLISERRAAEGRQ
jgi:hypothetical protein